MSALPWGCHKDFCAEEYHAIKDAASASSLRMLREKTPAHLRKRMDEAFTPNPAMMFGTLVHARLLEPDKEPTGFIVRPDTLPNGDKWHGSKKECKAWLDQAESWGLVVMTKEEIDEVDDAVKAIQECPEAKELLEGSDTEVTMFFQDHDGFPCKARLDLVPKVNILADIKTCQDASDEGFQRHAWNWGYHLQAAFYLDAWLACGDRPINEFHFIAYEKGSRLVKVHKCSEALIERGRNEYRAALDTFKRCVQSNHWPGYEGVSTWDVPRWA